MLPFFQEWASNERAVFSAADQDMLRMIAERFRQADGVVIHLGGKAGRLGESVVETALLEGVLLALAYLGQAGIPVTIIVDAEVAALFDASLYQRAYWEQITVLPAAFQHAQAVIAQSIGALEGSTIFLLDVHAAHDEMPRVQVQVQRATDATGAALARNSSENQRTIITLAHLARVGVRSYASRGPRRRYAAFIENLFSLPEGVVDDARAQPTLRLAAEDEQRYLQVASEIGLDPRSTQIICFFQSIVVAKCYTQWDDVLALLCQYFAANLPGQKLEFLLACGPDEQQPPGFEKAEMERWFAGFSGVNGNARVILCSPALRDLAILTRRARLALSNDTGPGHMAGALQIPVVVPYLPGTLYSKQVWASSLWHHGVTLDPNPYSFQELEAAVLWDKTEIIDAIPPERLFDEIVAIVQSLPHLRFSR